MECKIRAWKLEDAEGYIQAMLSADITKIFAFAITVEGGDGGDWEQ